MRRLHSLNRRAGGTFLPAEGGQCRGQKNFHDRKPRQRRKAASAATSVLGRWRAPMRLLHVWNDYVGAFVVEQKSRPHRGGDRAGHGWQHLPLRNVWTNRQRHQQRGKKNAGGEMKATIKSKHARRNSRISPPAKIMAKVRDRAMADAGAVEEPPVEIERYELAAGPAYNFSHHRSTFFKLLGSGI